MEQKCVNCGYCPTCGRSNQLDQNIRYYGPMWDQFGTQWRETGTAAPVDTGNIIYTTS